MNNLYKPIVLKATQQWEQQWCDAISSLEQKINISSLEVILLLQVIRNSKFHDFENLAYIYCRDNDFCMTETFKVLVYKKCKKDQATFIKRLLNLTITDSHSIEDHLFYQLKDIIYFYENLTFAQLLDDASLFGVSNVDLSGNFYIFNYINNIKIDIYIFSSGLFFVRCSKPTHSKLSISDNGMNKHLYDFIEQIHKGFI